ncbi:hypothetical protein ACFW04_003719 [Cataglyphis niger]
MATSAAVHLLTAWGFSEKIIGRFVDQEIEADQFKNLTNEDLKILIPNIEPRKFQNNVKKYLNETTQQSIENVDPNNKLQAIQQDLDINHVAIKKQNKNLKQNEDNEINEDNISITENISPIPSTSSTSAEYDIIFLTNNAKSETEINAATDNKYNLYLKKSKDGQLLLSLYKNEGKLNNGQRNKLAKIIVSNESSPNISNIICSERASFLSDYAITIISY